MKTTHTRTVLSFLFFIISCPLFAVDKSQNKKLNEDEFSQSDKINIIVTNEKEFDIHTVQLDLMFDLSSIRAVVIEDLNVLENRCSKNKLRRVDVRLYYTKFDLDQKIKKLTTHLKLPCVHESKINLRLKVAIWENNKIKRYSNTFKVKLWRPKGELEK